MPTVFADLLHKYPDDADAFRRFEPKPNGGFRPITVPNKSLKKWHRKVLSELDRRHPVWPGYVHGGVKGRSFVTFARQHVDQRHVITIDISKCFDAISGEQIAATLQSHLDLSQPVSEELAFALCFNNRLAQGFPTSSFLCNLYLSNQLAILKKSFDAQGLILGNYVDDIAISGIIANPDSVVNEVALSLSRSHLKMAKAKIHVMPSSIRQEICGLTVNKRLAVSRKLEGDLYHGIRSGALQPNVAAGWIAHIKSIDPILSKRLYDHAVKCGLIKPTK